MASKRCLLPLGHVLTIALLSTPRPLTDDKGRIFSVLAGQPNDPSYVAAAQEAFELIYEAGVAERFRPEVQLHRREHFPALAMGISYGKGQQIPSNIKLNAHKTMLETLISSAPIMRLARYTDRGSPRAALY